MATTNKDHLARELDNLLEDYRERLERIRFEVPDVEGPAAQETAKVSQRVKRVAAPPRRAVPAEPGPPRTEAEAVAAAPVPSPTDEPGARTGRPLRRGFKIAAAAAAAAAVAIGITIFSPWRTRVTVEVHRSFPIASAHVAGLAVRERSVYTVDTARQLMFLIDPDNGRIKAVQRFSNPSLTGLAAGDGYFWSTDAGSGYIYQHIIDLSHSVRRAYSNPDHSPSAIYWDGWNLWTSDLRTETIYQYALSDSLTPVRQYSLPGVSPAGIYVSENTLWVCDINRRIVTRYHVGTAISATDYLDLNGWLPPNATITGFAADASYLWVITAGPTELHRFRTKHLSWQVPETFSAGPRGPRQGAF